MVKRQVGIDIPKGNWLMITLHNTQKGDDKLDSLVTVMKDKLVEKVFGEIVHRFFKGRYYSNKYNFAQIITELSITTEEYNVAVNKLVKSGILVEIRERVYSLNRGYAILSRKDMEDLTKE